MGLKAILWFMLKEYGTIQEKSLMEEHMIKIAYGRGESITGQKYISDF